MTLPSGFRTDPGADPAEDHIGPFFYQRTGDRTRYAFVASEKHCNTSKMVHGGVLMTFADYALCMEATGDNEDCVTVSFNSNFISAANKGDLIECHASVTRKTRSLIFVTGELSTAGNILLTFSSIVKRIRTDR